MVAVINTGTSIRRAFRYNENKLEGGAATLLMAVNYPRDTAELTGHQRLELLLKMSELRPDVKVNSVHISLNFAPSESLSDGKMREIARDYMDRIGFGNQPYLIYRHHDAGHEHLHIVTTNIEGGGTRIPLHHLGRLRSEPARKALEERYGLVRAEDHKDRFMAIHPVDAARLRYGEKETRRAMSAVLGKVVDGYRFTSLPELNAVLRLYNMEATRGGQDSRTYRSGGLVYRVLDADGTPVGVPIKASLFHNRPTLKALEKRFLRGEVERQRHKKTLRGKIDLVLKAKGMTMESFAEKLKQRGIHVMARTASDGRIYGLTYVDIYNKCVFNGSALGRGYSAAAIAERFPAEENSMIERAAKEPQMSPGRQAEGLWDDTVHAGGGEGQREGSGSFTALLDLLLRYEYAPSAVAYGWRKKKKRRKKARRI